MIDDKRRYVRQPATIALKVMPAGRPSFATESVDLSVGGMFVKHPRGAETMVFGEQIELEIDLPELGPTRLPAFVRWLRGDGFGLQFGLLGAVQTHALANLVSSQRA